MNELLFIVVFAAIILLIFLMGKSTEKQNFTQQTAPCTKDEDCRADGSGDFCYMGKCWGYWKGYPMPWSSCKNPYCGCTAPGCSCSASGQGACLPYCKCKLNRRPGGSIDLNCFPKCGTACTTNDDCPAGCPQCWHGQCSAPKPGTPVW